MKTGLKIRVGELEADAWLNETGTAARVIEILPINSSVNVWGEEIYFSIPVEAGLEDARETVELGDIAYWPRGNALCVFFGSTPVSEGDEIRPASPVNIIGRIEGDSELFHKLLENLKRGEEIAISGQP
ncbi:MAG TPA: hypothetical protein G4O13_03795 [Dehalococcoidia bacterium]|nr:hypothetical protein [Dehalococcoidia bacterium]